MAVVDGFRLGTSGSGRSAATGESVDRWRVGGCGDGPFLVGQYAGGSDGPGEKLTLFGLQPDDGGGGGDVCPAAVADGSAAGSCKAPLLKIG